MEQVCAPVSQVIYTISITIGPGIRRVAWCLGNSHLVTPEVPMGQVPLLQNSTYSNTSGGIVMTMGIVKSNKELILKHAASSAWKRCKTGKEGHRGLCPTFPVCAGYRRHCWKHISKIIIYKNEGQNSRLETGSGRRSGQQMGDTGEERGGTGYTFSKGRL